MSGTPDYLDINDGDQIAVQAPSRNKARQQIAGEFGMDYIEVRANKRWMRECDCEGCGEDGPEQTHGYSSYWVFCEKTDTGAVEWWVA